MLRLVAIVILIGSAACFIWSQHKSDSTAQAWSKTAPAADEIVFEKVLEYRQRRDFERAVNVAIESENGKQPDDFLLQTTAVTYFQRAQVDQSNREKWVALAVRYSERALEANPKDVVNVFNLGDSYLTAGMNLQMPQGCKYYDKSLQVFQGLKADPGLEGDWGIMEGERVRLQPYRQKLDEHIDELRMLATSCPHFEKKQ